MLTKKRRRSGFPETYEMLEILKKERGSFNDVIQDMLSEFAPEIFGTIKDESDPEMEIIDFGTPKYAAWRKKCLLSAAKRTYIEFKKREWCRIEDGDFPQHPRFCTKENAPGQKDLKMVF